MFRSVILFAVVFAAALCAKPEDYNYTAFQDLERCDNASVIGSGAKNLVFRCTNARKEVRRVAFWAHLHKAEGTVAPGVQDKWGAPARVYGTLFDWWHSPQRNGTATACRVSTASFLAAVNETLAIVENLQVGSEAQVQALRDARFVLGERKKEADDIDVVALDTWTQEQMHTAEAAMLGLSMGVNVPLSSHRVPLPLHRPPKCNSKMGGKLDDTAMSNVVMVIERQKLLEGSFRSESLNATHAARVLYDWLAGQVEMYDANGRFHGDGHPGNLLVVNATSKDFVWNDFGKTSSMPGHPEAQFDNAITAFADQIAQFDDLKRFADKLREAKGKKADVQRTLFYHLLSDLVDNSTALRSQRHRMAGRFMGLRVSIIEETIKQMRENHDNQMNQMQDQIKQLQKDIAKLSNPTPSQRSETVPQNEQSQTVPQQTNEAEQQTKERDL